MPKSLYWLEQTCSWCHESNRLSIEGSGGIEPAFCKTCGHRADVPRLLCDCGQCHPPEVRETNEAGTSPAST